MEPITEKDEIKAAHESLREQAIQFGKAWIEILVESYVEPTRAGTPKGQNIGLSRKKYEVALLMILYSRFGLNLKEIGAIAKVSEGLIRLWRTEDDFQKVSFDAIHSFSEVFANTIDYYTILCYEADGKKEELATLKASLIEKTYLKIETRLLESYPGAKFPMSAVLFLCDLVPFFNEWVFQSVIERSLKTGYAGSVSSSYHRLIGMRISMRKQITNKNQLKKWTIKYLESSKMGISNNLEYICKLEDDKERRSHAQYAKYDLLPIRCFSFLRGKEYRSWSNP